MSATPKKHGWYSKLLGNRWENLGQEIMAKIETVWVDQVPIKPNKLPLVGKLFGGLGLLFKGILEFVFWKYTPFLFLFAVGFAMFFVLLGSGTLGAGGGAFTYTTW